MFSTLHNALSSCSPFVCKVTVEMNLGHISITSAPIVKVDIPLLLFILFALWIYDAIWIVLITCFSLYNFVNKWFSLSLSLSLSLVGKIHRSHVDSCQKEQLIKTIDFCSWYEIDFCSSFVIVVLNAVPCYSGCIITRIRCKSKP